MENRKKNEELQKLKKQRIDIYSSKDFKNFDKEKEKHVNKQKEEQQKEKLKDFEHKSLLHIGVVDE